MKRAFIGLMIVNAVYTSDDASLSKRRKISLALPSLQDFKDQAESQSDQGSYFNPSPGRRERSREVSLLSQEILKCKDGEKFEELCCDVKSFINKYQEYMNRTDFVEKDGAPQTGREVLHDSLLNLLREVGINKQFISAKSSTLTTEDENFSMLKESSSSSEDNRIKRLQRADLVDPFKRCSRPLQLPLSQEPSDDMHVSWSQVSSETSDSE